MKMFSTKTGFVKIKYFLFTVFVFGSFQNLVFAQTPVDDPYIDGDLSVAQCIANGNIDFNLFLDSIIYNDGFVDGIFEPWMDVLTRNKCQAADVSGLIKQQDKIRKYIRDAFLTCKNEKIPSLRVAHTKLNIEIYYVRKVVDGEMVLSLPYEFLTTRMLSDEESLYTPSDELYSDMYYKYVAAGEISKEDFDLFFSKLEFKYKDRKKTYIICEESSFDQVKDKWQEFKDTGAGTIPALKNLKKTVGGRYEKIAEALTDVGFADYLSGLIQFNLNNMDAKEGFMEIYENLDKYVPNIDVPTQSDMLLALNIAEQEYDYMSLKNELASNFEVLYRDTSDLAVELLVTELDDFNNTIEDSFAPLDSLLECTEVMNDRQCPGKF
jgi:hypothetical protein